MIFRLKSKLYADEAESLNSWGSKLSSAAEASIQQIKPQVSTLEPGAPIGGTKGNANTKK